MNSVSFTMNTCNADAPFLEETLRHMVPALNYPFSEKLIAYDPGNQEGKYSKRIQGSQAEIERILERLLNDGVIDRVDIIPWGEEDQCRILHKYFGREDIDIKDFSGAPIYQYLYALDKCTGNYIFHSDSDMLFYREGEASWIQEGIDLLHKEATAIVTTPRGGPPQAKNWREWLTGKSFEKPPVNPWRPVTFTSTRYFLLDAMKFKQCLPLEQEKQSEPLENSLTYTFKNKGYERWSLINYQYWAIHPWSHDENYVRHLSNLIWAVENNIYPFRRSGYQWDMRTDGKLIKQWLRVLRANKRKLN